MVEDDRETVVKAGESFSFRRADVHLEPGGYFKKLLMLLGRSGGHRRQANLQD